MKAHHHIWIVPLALLLWAASIIVGLALLLRDLIMHFGNPKPATRNQKPETRNTQPATRNTQHPNP